MTKPSAPPVVMADHALRTPDAAALSGPTRLIFDGRRLGGVEDADPGDADPGDADPGDANPGDAGSGDGQGRIAMAGLVNAHDHGRGFRSLAFGADDDVLEAWLPGLLKAPPSDPYTVAAVAFGRLAGAGVTAINHCHIPTGGDPVEEAKAVARAASDVGVRLAFVVPIVDRNAVVYGGPEAICGHYDPDDWALIRRMDGDPAPAEEQIALVDAIAGAIEDEGISVQYGPAGPQWVSDQAQRAIAEASARTGRRVHMHLLESWAQREWSDARYNGGVVTQLERNGLLTDCLTLAHGVWLSEEEIIRLAAAGATVVVNTSSNLRLCSGLAPVRDFQRGGLSFALGLDGMAFDDDEDMLRELRLTTRLHGPRAIGQPGLSRAAALSACLTAGRRTIDGAKGYGALTPGADGDVVLLDSRGFSGDALEALVDPLALLNARATRHDVREVYCAGRCIVRAGRLQGLDLPAAEEALLAEARSAVASLGERAPLVERHQATVRRYYGQGHHVDAARRARHADQHADQSADQQKGS